MLEQKSRRNKVVEKSHKEFFEKLKALLTEFDATIAHDGVEPIYVFFEEKRNLRFYVGSRKWLAEDSYEDISTYEV